MKMSLEQLEAKSKIHEEKMWFWGGACIWIPMIGFIFLVIIPWLGGLIIGGGATAWILFEKHGKAMSAVYRDDTEVKEQEWFSE